MTDRQVLEGTVPLDMGGERIDHVVVEMFPDFSRSRLQQWIKSGELLVDGNQVKQKFKVIGDEKITIDAAIEDVVEMIPQDVPLDIIYEDDDIIVINKPVGLVVHPGSGHDDGTMMNGLLYHDAELAKVPRAGIVHRLDKDTSGLLVTAKNISAHKHLVDQLQERTVSREYMAIVKGVLVSGGTVEEPIGRHYVDRKKMAVVQDGKEAITHYRVQERFEHHSLVKVKLETGRTHQIRVHMAHIKHSLVGDQVYGGRLQLPKNCSEEMKLALRGAKRQMLHAWRLGLIHPVTGEEMFWEAGMPEDMEDLLDLMRYEAGGHNDDDGDMEVHYVFE
ncbi:MAG: 23S rRNA pseudouridine(1911/1915/1917) synthase RluD [Gammaproteobacteria bacterium]|nr:MAG: 23S rRNA pseudouridine(1911/1915/1917) synthase RluD [Gammaproteobacteria bacterium]